VARFDRQQLQELIRDSSSCGTTIFQTMTDRLSMAPQCVKETPSSRVLLVGSPYDADCRGIRTFLSANRVHYAGWITSLPRACFLLCPARARWSCCGGRRCDVPSASDGSLGFQTQPKDECYDVVIAGAGPAGMAAGVYGASEGLKVLVDEAQNRG
jgi:thioredoxin reductase (NADPH)